MSSHVKLMIIISNTTVFKAEISVVCPNIHGKLYTHIQLYSDGAGYGLHRTPTVTKYNLNIKHDVAF